MFLKTPKCPHCSEELEEDDCYDTTTDFTEDGLVAIVQHCVGHCPACEKEFQWEEVYAFREARKVVEIT